MAPIILDTTSSPPPNTSHDPSSGHFLWMQDVPPEMMVVGIVAISTATALIFAGIAYVIVRVCRRVTPSDSLESGIQQICPMEERRESNWLQRHSEALWDDYIGEDDLSSHFSKPSTKSRMFSIASVSTLDTGRCPLDRRPSPLQRHPLNRTDTATSKDALLGSPAEVPSHEVSVCRPAWWDQELDLIPTDDSPRPRAASQPHPYTDKTSFEDLKSRKQSLPAWQILGTK
ncbi:hypothetical protein B0A52_09809 [Exophiala mesophila]|uniref:Uncharacterized protein n=1 Tax=Exophiala mesophila TaxID=212818 RepID=A0A438MS97_EXOME|nr:hypothetical protein B0A52_09809 [Exophiala mesophila]